jgi:type II secretory pathway component PulJ
MNREPFRSASESEAGFTLAETVVALSLVLLVTGLLLAAFLFGARQVWAWQNRLALGNAAHLVQTRLATELRRAEHIGWTREGMRLSLPDSVLVTYQCADSVLVRNGRQAHRDGIVCRGLRLAILDSLNAEIWDSRRAGAHAQSIPAGAAARVDLRLSDGRQERDVLAVTSSRHPAVWHAQRQE